MRGALTVRGWLVEVETKPGIVTQARGSLTGAMGTVSQHSYSIRITSMSSLYTRITHRLPAFQAQPNLRDPFT